MKRNSVANKALISFIALLKSKQIIKSPEPKLTDALARADMENLTSFMDAVIISPSIVSSAFLAESSLIVMLKNITNVFAYKIYFKICMLTENVAKVLELKTKKCEIEYLTTTIQLYINAW